MHADRRHGRRRMLVGRERSRRSARRSDEEVVLADPAFSMTFSAGYVATDLGLWAEARHQGEDRADHRHRRDQLGDLRQLAVRAGLGQLVRPRQRARTEARRHRHHDRPAVRATDPAQGHRCRPAASIAKAPLEKRGALLKGRTIAVDSINSMIHAYVRLLAARAGINPDDIRIAPMAPTSMLAAFQSKQIDGFAMSLPWPLKPVQDGEATADRQRPGRRSGRHDPVRPQHDRGQAGHLREAQVAVHGDGPVDQGRHRLHQEQAGRGLRAAEEALPDARRQAAGGRLRGAAEGHAVAAGRHAGGDRELARPSTSTPGCSRPTRSSNPTTACSPTSS